MAQLNFTENALLHIRSTLATQPLVYPVVSVGWWKGTFDNSRNPNGSVNWQPVEPARWYAIISDWDQFPAPVDRESLLDQMHGFNVFRDEQARSAPGALRVTLTEAGLRVEHAAT